MRSATWRAYLGAKEDACRRRGKVLACEKNGRSDWDPSSAEPHAGAVVPGPTSTGGQREYFSSRPFQGVRIWLCRRELDRRMRAGPVPSMLQRAGPAHCVVAPAASRSSGAGAVSGRPARVRRSMPTGPASPAAIPTGACGPRCRCTWGRSGVGSAGPWPWRTFGRLAGHANQRLRDGNGDEAGKGPVRCGGADPARNLDARLHARGKWSER
jgi:hypothetical protein